MSRSADRFCGQQRKDDRVVRIELGRAMAAAIPGAKLVELVEAGHVPTVIQAPAVALAISEFFSM